MILSIPKRFNGPASSGNGGITAGRVAALLSASDPVQVTLRMPPPLDVGLRTQPTRDGLDVLFGDDVIASAIRAAAPKSAVPPVDFADALIATQGYDGRVGHPFPTCFVCGPERPMRDGLEIFAGPIEGDPHRTGAPFVPRPEHATEGVVTSDIVWGALDCPGGWAIGLPQRPAVLGRMTAIVSDVPAVGEHCVIVGVMDAREGRKAFTRTTAYGQDGRELGRAAAVWIEINNATVA